MSKTKTFKTVSGYLRSVDDQVQSRIPWDASDEARIAAIKTGLRDSINNLLPQFKLPPLNDDETPLDGVTRLLAIGGDKRQVKVLKDCQRWLKNYRILMKVTTSVSSVTVEGR